MRKITDIASPEEREIAQDYWAKTTSDQMGIDLVYDLLSDCNYHAAARVLSPYYKGVYDTYSLASRIANEIRWDVYGAAIIGCLILEDWGHFLAEELNDFVVQDDPTIFEGY